MDQTLTMDEASLDPDPLAQLTRWLETAAAAGEPMPEAMALATATPAGWPSSRMVLLRGINGGGLVFFTDRESEKGRDLETNPFAAALFHWHLPAHRQVRVSGAVEEVDDDQSDAYWESRPRASRISAVVSHQSQVIAGRDELEQKSAALTEALPDDAGPLRPDRWGGYRIRPEVIEFWEEGAHRLHDRIRFRSQAGDWAIERLSP
jgi:pyridoxamine 5'-phosphate oxidase